ncbi:LysR family transcriptional regulator [Alteromonas stellipolaris]|uniref:LysR family transcriptional regulator n=1 Tax=Alteromonas stellipolaris TaxID=233316 RepID=UPI0027369ED9|nr:LysR family transcriptional regulator [Alteromonas stellipolaris]MDP2534591.1 LysR family transcriptional regulator [Alteromonas stellipolaris]
MFNIMNTVKLAPLLLIFVEVAHKRSFTLAAKKLGISKSAISQQITKLESEIGQQLLIRNTRGVILTAVGETLLARSELFSEQIDLTVAELDSAKSQPSGLFKVSVPPFFEKDIVVPALKQLCIEFPKINPQLLVTGRWQDLIENKLDAAIFGGNIKDCDYRALSIGEVSEIFCASPRYIKQYGNINNIQKLLEHKFIATEWQHDTLHLFDNNHANEALIDVKHFAKTNTPTTALEMVLNDMGVALLPEFLVHSLLAEEQIRRVIPSVRGKAWHFYYLHQYKGEKPLHVTRFYQLFKHYFAKVNS